MKKIISLLICIFPLIAAQNVFGEEVQSKKDDNSSTELKLKGMPDYNLKFDFDDKGEINDLFVEFDEAKLSIRDLIEKIAKSMPHKKKKGILKKEEKKPEEKIVVKEEKIEKEVSQKIEIKKEEKNDIAEILIKYENTTLTMTPLMQAIEEEDFEAATSLINYGASVLEQKGGEPLFLACTKENVPTSFIRLLIQNGAKISNINKESPLISVINTGRKDLIDLLIKNGSDVNRIYKASEDLFITPLDFACYKNPIKISRIEMVKFLVKKGAHVVDPRSNGYPIFWAVCSEDIDTLRYLIEEGADVNSFPIEKKSPLKMAIELKSKEMITLLLKNGAKVGSK